MEREALRHDSQPTSHPSLLRGSRRARRASERAAMRKVIGRITAVGKEREGRSGRRQRRRKTDGRTFPVRCQKSQITRTGSGKEGRGQQLGPKIHGGYLAKPRPLPREQSYCGDLFTLVGENGSALSLCLSISPSPIFSANVTLYHSLALEQLCNVALRLPSSFTPLQSPIRILPSRRLIPCLRSLPPSSPSRRPRRAAH